jgi:hypothetical protein
MFDRQSLVGQIAVLERARTAIVAEIDGHKARRDDACQWDGGNVAYRQEVYAASVNRIQVLYSRFYSLGRELGNLRSALVELDEVEALADIAATNVCIEYEELARISSDAWAMGADDWTTLIEEWSYVRDLILEVDVPDPFLSGRMVA